MKLRSLLFPSLAAIFAVGLGTFAEGDVFELKKSSDAGRTFVRVSSIAESLEGEILLDRGMPRRMMVGTTNGKTLISNDEGATWNLCSNVEGMPISFYFDQNSPTDKRRCFAATKTGIWRSYDGGIKWDKCVKNLSKSDILAFAGSSDEKKGKSILYCSVRAEKLAGEYSGGIFRSVDGGDSWESAMGAGINRDVEQADQWADDPVAQYLCLLASDAAFDRIYAFNTSTGFNPPHHNAVFRSDDAGRDWRATFYSDPRWKEYNVEPNWRTANIGQNYQSAGSGWAICGSDPDRIVFCDSMCLYATHDGGRTWFNGNCAPAGGVGKGVDSRWLNQGLVVTSTWHHYSDPFVPSRRYICCTDIGFVFSTDSGASWNWWGKDRWAPWRNTCHEIAFDPEEKGLLWGAFSDVHDIPNSNIIHGRHRGSGGGGVCRSDDHGNTWLSSSKGLPNSATTSIVLDAKSPRGSRTLYAGIWEHGVYKSVDGGRTWRLSSDGLGSPENKRVSRVFLHPDGKLFALVTGMRREGRFSDDGAGLYCSTDGEESWIPASPRGKFPWPKDFTVSPDDSNLIYLGSSDANGKEGGLYLSTDGGGSWNLILRKGREHFGAYIDPFRKGWIYATLCEGAQESGLYLSKNGGRSFAPISGIPFSNVQCIEFVTSERNSIYATTFGGSVWKGSMKGNQ